MTQDRSARLRSFQVLYESLDRISFGALGVLTQAVRSLLEQRGPEAAASLAYYAFFSLFPFLLVTVAIASFFFEDQRAQQELLNLITRAFPVSRQIIQNNIERVLELRGAVGIAAIAGLLWSASGFFNTLIAHVNRAWSNGTPRGFLTRRSLAMVIVLALFALAALGTFVLDLLPSLRIPIGGGTALYETAAWTILSSAVSVFLRLVLFFSLYRWVPSAEVRPSAAFWGALTASLFWEAATQAFSQYLGGGLARYELVYGSLGAVVALLFWIYLSSLITLFGAHLTAVLSQSRLGRAQRWDADQP